jgi:hypothetical protein
VAGQPDAISDAADSTGHKATSRDNRLELRRRGPPRTGNGLKFKATDKTAMKKHKWASAAKVKQAGQLESRAGSPLE